ncbi:methionyl-tRNA formyltransferase [Aquimarina sp. W85]|uniref:methionyl-tRNA formyltransferase n=1 Tax=Aquimarina rhodophyticola TaxID=3342246 RepID=UPI00366C0446
MNSLKILFMGTPDFAVETLKTILDNNYEVVGVVTAPDRPAGRGRKLNTSAVKDFALTKALPILQPTNLKDETFITTVKELGANLNIVVAFRMLPKVIWDMPKFGTFNLHASLLPAYRGAAPINWALINGEKKTGVTTFFIDEKIDTGAIILQKEIHIDKKDNAGTLHDKLMKVGAKLVITTLECIQTEQVNLHYQSTDTTTKTAYKLNKDNTKIDWSTKGETIYNLIRGLNPYPTAWCKLSNKDQILAIKIYEVEFIEENHSHKIGTLITDESTIKVAVLDGFIKLMKIQLPGKRAMDTASLLNGYKFDIEAQVS